jgi:hypothetical protein
MKLHTIAVVLAIVLLGGCVTQPTVKSPCVGAPASPCGKVPLPNEPIEEIA